MSSVEAEFVNIWIIGHVMTYRLLSSFEGAASCCELRCRRSRNSLWNGTSQEFRVTNVYAQSAEL